MLTNYLKIALRNLRRQPMYATINIVGLAIGIACCLVILLFVKHELSYDRHNEHADRIYRIVSDWGDFSVPATNPPLVSRLKTAYPALKHAWVNPYNGLISFEDRRFQENNIYFVNDAFFEVFSLNILQGVADMSRPATALITPEIARKYFGDLDPIGKTFEVDNQFELEVVGLIEEAHPAAHFHFDILVSWATLDAFDVFDYDDAWGNNSIYTYLLLPEGFEPETLESAFPEFIARHAGDDWNTSELSLQALTDIHLHSNHNSELEPNGSIVYIYMFSAIALFILLIACVNFMNLATARSAERAREVGIRKVVGADRRQLVRQFLLESTLLSIVAVLLALVLVYAALPYFRELSNRDLSLDLIGAGFVLPLLLVVAVLVGITAGSYPAFVLSAFRPIAVLKGAFKSTAQGKQLRKVLVVFQFAISITLIVGTGVIYSQLNYLKNVRLGFDKEQVLQARMHSRLLYQQYGAFKDALLQNANVQAVSISSERIPDELLNGNRMRFEGAPDDPETMLDIRTVSVGHDFFEALGTSFIAGRPFRMDIASDSNAFILNETAWRIAAARANLSLAAPDSSIGLNLYMGSRSGQLVGIVKDFNMASLHEAIEPIIFYFQPSWYDNFLFRLNPGDITNTLAYVERTWRTFYPEWPFEFQFADQGFDARYRSEERLGRLFTTFALLALAVGCLGLFGLASFTTQQRTKEIGVRKVLGASVGSVIVLLSKEFSWLVILSLFLAVPVSWLVMSRWLEGFAYSVSIAWWLYPAAGLLALLIAWLTVSAQSIKAALSNPVEALRYE